MLAQYQILNKVLATKDMSLITKNDLKKDYFYQYPNEFEFLTNHYKTYASVPDLATFLSVFADFTPIDVQEPDSYLISQLFEDYNQATLAIGFNTIKKYLEGGDVQKAQDYFNQISAKLQQSGSITCTDLLKDVSRYDSYMERTADKAKYYVTTGLPELDALIGGIDRENENMVIYARTGQGKTQLMMYMAAAAARQGLRVGIYEGEMTADKTGYRFDTCYGHIKNKAINRGELYIQREYKRYIDSLASLDTVVLVMTPNDVPGGSVTVNSLRTFIERNKLDILFVDQYDLLDDTSNARAKHEKIGNIAKNVKLLQVEKQIPIISVCQMTREKNDDGSIDSTQVAGSDMISRYATILLALEQKYDKNTNKVELDVNIVKARDGGDHNKLKYAADFNMGYLEYIPSEGDGVTSKEDIKNMADSYEYYPEMDGEEAY